jgi:transposase
LAAFVGLIPSEYSSGPARRQGGITKAGNGHAGCALIEGAWAYRHPAKVSEHIQRRIDTLPKPIQDLGWKAQVRCASAFDDSSRVANIRTSRSRRSRAN